MRQLPTRPTEPPSQVPALWAYGSPAHGPAAGSCAARSATTWPRNHHLKEERMPQINVQQTPNGAGRLKVVAQCEHGASSRGCSKANVQAATRDLVREHLLGTGCQCGTDGAAPATAAPSGERHPASWQ